MATGVEILFNTLLKSMKIDPEEVKQKIAMTTQAVVETKDQLDRIERKQDAILNHLNERKGITHVTEDGTGNGRTQSAGNGNENDFGGEVSSQT